MKGNSAHIHSGSTNTWDFGTLVRSLRPPIFSAHFPNLPFSRWDRTSIATQEDLAQLVRTCTRCCREIEGYEKEIEEFSALGNQLARTSGDPSANGGAGVKTVQNSITTIQKKFESLKQEFSKDTEDLDKLLTQFQLVEAKKVEAQDYLEGLESKLKDARTSAMNEESPSDLFNQLISAYNMV